MRVAKILILAGVLNFVCADDVVPEFAKSAIKAQHESEKMLIETALKGDLDEISTDLKIEEIKEDGEQIVVGGKFYRALEKPSNGWQKGDVVRFLNGNANAKCLNTIILNLRTKEVNKFLCDA